MRSGVTLIAVLALAAQPVAAQFPRLAPPPPCKASISSPAYLAYWPSMAGRDTRAKIAVFSLQADVDDAAKVYLSIALPERIRQRLSVEPKLRVAAEGTISRALADARSRQDSAGVLLGADYLVTGRLFILGDRQEVEVILLRPGQAKPIWQASFRATTSFRSVEEAIVRGLSRALGLRAAPPMPQGWPRTDEAHEAILAGDAHLRSPTLAGADSAHAQAVKVAGGDYWVRLFDEGLIASRRGDTSGVKRALAGLDRDPRLAQRGGLLFLVGNKDSAYAMLNRAFDARDVDLLQVLNAMPALYPFRQEPRYQDLLARMGMPERLRR